MRQRPSEKLKPSSFSLRSTKQTQKTNKQLPQNMKQYLLQDYTFLNEYQLLDSPLNSEFQFLARIKSTQQLVKFKKKPFIFINTTRGESIYKRFQVMYALFQKGIILADNIFILQQANKQYFYYVIEPYLSRNEVDSPFVTLKQYLFENRQSLNNFQAKKSLFIKCKNLLDNLSLYEHSYCGLNSRKIIIDDEGNTFLLPFQLEIEVLNKPYERSYYPAQVLKYLCQQQNQQNINLTQKWDIWSFGCIILDIFLYLTPYFLSTSIEKQSQRIQKQTCNIFEDFQTQFIIQNKLIQNISSKKKGNTFDEVENQRQDRQKILNFLMNIFHQDQNKRHFSFQPILNETQLLKTQRQRRTSRVKSSTRRLFEKTMLKSKDKAESRTERYLSLINSSIYSSRIFAGSKQELSNFKQLNVFEKINSNKQKSNKVNQMYSFELKIKSLILQDLALQESKNNLQVKIVVNFYNCEKFQFFINLTKENKTSQITINRKISFTKRQIQFIESLLQQEIQILLSTEEQTRQKEAEILINLSALIIKNQLGERMWKKPIKGTYTTQNNSDFQCKFKIEAQVIGKDQNQSKILKTLNRSKFNNQQKNVRNIEPFDFLKESVKTINLKDLHRQQNFQESVQTSRFQEPMKDKTDEKVKTSGRSRKSSFSKFSQINSQLDEISSYWKQKISIENEQKKQFQQQIQKSNTKNEQNNLVLRERNIDVNQKIDEQIKPKQEIDLQNKVKKILQLKNGNEKLTKPVDLTKKLKRLLMK